jgi:hypothetical protein
MSQIENGLLQHKSEEEWKVKGGDNFSSVLGETELEEARYEEGYGRFRGCNKMPSGYFTHKKPPCAVTVRQSRPPML